MAQVAPGYIWDALSVHPEDEDALCFCGHRADDHGTDDSHACVRIVRRHGRDPQECDCEAFEHDASRDCEVIEERENNARL